MNTETLSSIDILHEQGKVPVLSGRSRAEVDALIEALRDRRHVVGGIRVDSSEADEMDMYSDLDASSPSGYLDATWFLDAMSADGIFYMVLDNMPRAISKVQQFLLRAVQDRVSPAGRPIGDNVLFIITEYRDAIPVSWFLDYPRLVSVG